MIGKMKLLPLVGAVVFFIIAQIAMIAYGITGGVVAAILMLALWLGSYVWKERAMDHLWHELNMLPHEKRIEVLSRADEDFLEAMVSRDRKKHRYSGQSQRPGK